MLISLDSDINIVSSINTDITKSRYNKSDITKS